MNNRQKVKSLLVHYFRVVFNKSKNLEFHNDNRYEIEEIIDLIFDEIDND